MNVDIGPTRLELVSGDVACQTTEAVVTAAHPKLNGGTGTDGAIHHKAGPRLLAACQIIGRCAVGSAVLTPGYELAAKWVIHAVGPVYRGEPGEAELLASAYRSALRLAASLELRSIALPSISTGAFGYPLAAAAPVALRTIVGFLDTEPHRLELVRLVLYPRELSPVVGVYERALSALLTARIRA